MSTPTNLPPLQLDKTSGEALFTQLYGAIKTAILQGAMAPGMQLPPSRTLARHLGVSRQTVVNAYEQLTAEGYLDCCVGRGSFVSEGLPPRRPRTAHRQPDPAIGIRPLSSRGRLFIEPALRMGTQDGPPKAFRSGMAALEAFPFDTWARLEARCWRKPHAPLGYSDPAGFMPLRELLSAHLRVTRGIRCDPEQVIITSGAQQAVHLTGQLLLNPGDKVWVENPGYRGARLALRAAGAELVPVPVDADGLRVEDGLAAAPRARLAYVTPSHQYPLGVTMGLPRRLALLDWAERHQAWIIEDDYDSEYRYTGPMLASLQSLDRAGSVLYIGTLSKSLFPGLRLGYLVVPPALVDAFRQGKSAVDRMSPVMPQAVLTEFIAGGHFHRQIKRTRELYDERRRVLLQELQRQLGTAMTAGPSNAGLQLAVAFRDHRIDDQAFAKAAAAKDIEVRALSSFYAADERNASLPAEASGLLLGFACVPTRHMRPGVGVLKALMNA